MFSYNTANLISKLLGYTNPQRRHVSDIMTLPQYITYNNLAPNKTPYLHYIEMFQLPQIHLN